MFSIENIDMRKTFIGSYGTVLVLMLLSYINCFDRLTWVLEVAPVCIGIVIMTILARRHQEVSTLLNCFIIVQMLILIVGGHYSYARVPLFDMFSEWFGWGRNNYDKVGHFVQGITPFLITKEILVRKQILVRGKLLNFLCIAVALAFSACYELIEFIAAVMLGSGAEEFLGTQGDVWDTQKDMLCALLGAISIATLTVNYNYTKTVPR